MSRRATSLVRAMRLLFVDLFERFFFRVDLQARPRRGDFFYIRALQVLIRVVEHVFDQQVHDLVRELVRNTQILQLFLIGLRNWSGLFHLQEMDRRHRVFVLCRLDFGCGALNLIFQSFRAKFMGKRVDASL